MRKPGRPLLSVLLLTLALLPPAAGCKSCDQGAAAPTPPLAAEATHSVIDLAFLARKQGPPLPRPEVRAGSPLVLGGFVRQLEPTAAGKASFWLSSEVSSGVRRLHHFRGPVAAPFDLPAEHALRVDLGLVVPPDAPPGPAVFHVQIEEAGRPATSADFPFTVLEAAPAAGTGGPAGP